MMNIDEKIIDMIATEVIESGEADLPLAAPPEIILADLKSCPLCFSHCTMEVCRPHRHMTGMAVSFGYVMIECDRCGLAYMDSENSIEHAIVHWNERI
jgi:hypothetical protein